MSEQAFWYDGGPRDPDYLEVADGVASFDDDDDDLDDEDDEDDGYLPH